MADPSTLAAALNYYGDSRLKRREFDGGEPPTIEGLGEQWQGVRETVNSALGGDQGPRPMMTDAQVWDRIKASGGGIGDYQRYALEQPVDPRIAEALFGATSNIGKGIVPALTKAIGSPGIRAYHGSPHDFDAFDASKIGTGEGAQAYGHGMYFAENEGVAKSYRDVLSDGKPRAVAGTDSELPGWVAARLESGGAKHAELRNEFTSRIKEMQDNVAAERGQYWNDANNIPGLQKIIAGIDAHEKGAAIAPAGRMYEVNIKSDPDRFLDWDKPLSEQKVSSEAIDSVLMRAPGAPPGRGESFGPYTLNELREYGATGRDLYDRLSWATGKPGAFPEINVATPSSASAALKEAGIPGIKYLDQGSRQGAADALAGLQKVQAKVDKLRATGASEDRLNDALQELQSANRAVKELSSNYVVFDPATIEILRKYGLLGMIGGGAAAAGAQPDAGQTYD